MKQVLTFIALLLTTISFAQNGNNSNTYYFRGTLAVGKGNTTIADTSSYLEVGNGFDTKGILPPRATDTTVLQRKEGLFAYTKDSRTLSFFDGTRWRQITDKRYVDSLVAASGGGGSTDTTSLSNRINLKQDQLNGLGFIKANGTIISYDNSTYTPTNRTLTINGTTQDLSSNRVWTIPTGTDTTSLSNRIDQKQNQLTGNGFVRAIGGVVSYDPNTYLTTEVDGDPLNEIQTISGSGNTITLSKSGGSYTIPPPDLTGYVQFSDTTSTIATKSDIVEASGGTIQSLNNNRVGNQINLGISAGGTGTSFSVADSDSSNTNEIQTLGRIGNQITLTNGGSVTDSSKTYLAGTGVSILGSYPNYTVSVDTTSIFSGKVNYYDSTTVFVTPSQLGNGNISIGTSGISTGSINFNLNQQGNASTTINTPGTNLGSSTSGTNRTITSSTGTSTTFSIADNDNSSTNEVQSLSISGNNLTISSGNTVALPIPNIDSITYQTVYRTDTMRTNIYNAIDGARTVGSTSIFKNGNSYEREALSGDVTAPRNSNTTTISNNAVTNTKAADMAASTIKGRASGAGTGDPQDLTAAQVRTILNVADGANNYVHPNSGITPGTYNSLTVNAQGHATAGALEPYLSKNDSNTVFITPTQLTDSLNGRVGNYLQFNDTLATIATKSDIISASGGTIQSLSNTKSGNNVALAISGGGAGTNFSVADADSSATNELQTVSRSGQTITLSNSGGSFVDSFSRYAAGTNVTITGSYPAYTINATQPSLTNYVQYSDTNTIISTKKNLIDTAASLRATINTKEDAFAKGSIVAGTNITTSGTLTNRLVGSGNITINAVVPSLTGYVQYSDTLTRIATRSYVDTAKANIRAQKEDAFSKGNLIQGTNATLTGTLTNRLVGAGNVTIDANLSSAVKYADTLTTIATKKNLADTSAALRTLIGTKQNQLNGTGFVKASGTTISYDNSTYVPTNRTITINGNTQDLSANRTWTIPIIDTTSLSNRINTKQNYSDTLTYDATKTWVQAQGYLTTEVDGSVTNEIQTLGRSGSNITLSLGGGSVIDSSRNYSAGSNVTITGTYPNYTVNAIQPSLTGYVQFSDTLTRIATRSYVDTAKNNIRNEKENTFLKGNVVAGTGVTLSGTTTGRLVGTGNITINATPTDLSGVVKYVDTNTVIATKKNLADTSSTLRGLINGKEDAFSKGSILAGTAVTLTGTGTNRLVGSGNLTVNADLSGTVKYTDTLTRIATRSYVDTAKANIRAEKENVFSKGNLIAGSNVTLSGTLANRLVGSGNVTINATAIDTTSLSNRINQKIDTAQKAQPNGVATLGGDGKVPTSQLPDAILGAVIYQGTYSVVTNTPTLPSAIGNKGKYYVVTDSGLYVPNSTVYRQGDWIISNGTVWQKVDNNNQVTSVNGQVGAVTITEVDPIWTAEKVDYMKNISEGSTFNITTGKGMFVSGATDAPTAVNYHGIYIPHSGASTTHGSILALRNQGFYFRSKEASVWQPWLRVADRDWVTSLGYTTNTGTVLSVAATVAGTALNVSGSPITTSGTLSFTWGGSTGDYVNGAGGLTAFPSTVSNLAIGTRTSTTMPITNSNGTGVTLPAATTSLAGLLTATDKTKLDGLANQTLTRTGNIATLSNGGGSITIADADSSNTNELQSLSKSGNIVTLSNGGGSISVADSDSSNTNELQNLGSSKSGNIVSATITSGTGTSFSIADADSSATNELQTISGSGNTITLSNGGGSYSIPSAAGTNIGSSRTSNNVTFTSSTGTGTVINVADADSSITNELQTISKVGSTVTLSNGGGSFTDDNTTYSAGTGISFSGTTINNTGDLSTTNEIQNLSLGTATSTTQPLNISLGTGTTLPSATTSTAGLLSASDKTKLDGLTNYTLPIASSTVLGGIKVGSGLSIAGDGTLSSTGLSTVNLGTSATNGEITNTAGTNAVLNSLATTATTDLNLNIGSGLRLLPFGSTTANTPYSGNGISLVVQRNASPTTQQRFEIATGSSSSGDVPLVFRTNTGGTWKTFADRQWVIDQGYTTNLGTVTSVGLSAPSAFTVSGSPVTGAGTLTLTGAGTTSQYIRGDGTLETFPTIPTYTGSTSITLSGSSFQRAALTGDVTAAANSNATTIANDVVTYTKLQNIASGTLIGRGAAGTGDPGAVTIGSGLALSAGNVLSSTVLDKWLPNGLSNYLAKNSSVVSFPGISAGDNTGAPGGIQTSGIFSTASTYTVLDTDHYMIFSVNCTVTLPNPNNYLHRILGLKTYGTVTFSGTTPFDNTTAITSFTGNTRFMLLQAMNTPSGIRWMVLQ